MTTTVCRDVSRLLGMRSLGEMPRLIDGILDELEELGYTEKERFGIRLALEEALVNAFKHGHRGDTSKTVRIRYQASMAQFVVEIEDQGPGFIPARVPDPLRPENLERPCGRGVFLMEHYMTWVRYNDRGNRVTLCKMRD